MLTLSSPTMPEAAAAMRSPGGFCWWYVDAIDADGNGFVVIWSFGLPFLPGYTSAARAGRAPASADVPALNVVLYRDGRPDFYLLQRYAPQQAAWDGAGEWRFGRTRIVAADTPDGRRDVTLNIDADVPGHDAPLVGEIRLRGALRPAAAPSADALPSGEAATHWWSPICAHARATLSLECGERTWVWKGAAYHDRNASLTHIDGLGIRRWTWARFCDGDVTRVLYELHPVDRGAASLVYWITMGDGGMLEIEQAQVLERRRARGTFGAPHYSRIRLMTSSGELTISDTSVLDDGFFYLRKAVQLAIDGRTVAGMAEEVLPSRVDRLWHRPLVRMAVDDPAARSIWLPLFAGARDGRWRRLLRLPGRRRLEANV